MAGFYYDPTLNTMSKKSTASRHDGEYIDIKHLLGHILEDEDLLKLTSKVCKMKYLSHCGYYNNNVNLCQVETKDILNLKLFWDDTDEHGKYKVKIPLDDLKHKIYHIRNLARDNYYGKKTSAEILNMVNEEIFTMKMYKNLNGKGKRIKK